MPLQTQEQIIHDRVNLGRLVKSLQGAVSSEEWQRNTSEPGTQAWLKVQGALHKVQYARRLLKNVELNSAVDDSSTSTERYQSLRASLNALEHLLQDAEKRVAPKPARPEPILPTLPLPQASSVAPVSPGQLNADQTDPFSSPTEPSAMLSAQDLLLSPSDTVPDTLAEEPTSASHQSSSRPLNGPLAPATTGAILQNSRAIQEELSEQLAQMATQLKRNALHFSNSLEKDKAVVQGAQEKLERNYDVMTKERKRLRDHHSKSWGTTWITILSIAVAIIGFFLTFFVIRFT
ncbi:hypothetical protein BXZ70DRAFT_2744 [Cristinia sonorae]|uniref:Synaptobrevin n=1 Tax=Cristinia sonorae TaxID=1940300 RepID=A0A8K0XUJ3_9AGAR|nr:hypothetical protein BXZ70DRAFT_2744 [Cristinia sonorae]